METLLEKLKEYNDSDIYPYHMPGHKRKRTGGLSADITGIDITEIDGFDDLHASEGILLKLQERAARLYGADESFFLVNGSTGGILSAISAALAEGEHILMLRGSHRSAYHAAYLRKLKVSYLYSTIIEDFDICDAVTAEQVEKALSEHEDIRAVFIVSPTYEGRIADVEKIAQVVHKKGIMLIVDEAHGAHLGFAEGFAKNSCQAGADIVIHSVHKTLPAMTQSALLHINGDLADREKIRRFLRIYQSSSPSYVLMAGIDNAVDLLENEKNSLFSSFYGRYFDMLNKLSKCRRLQFLPMSAGQDIGKLVISGKKAGISGRKIYDLLLNKYHLQLEMASSSYCLAMFTICDGEEAYVRMTNALLEIDGYLAEDADIGNISAYASELLSYYDREALPLWRAWDMECELVPLGGAAGKYSGEFINLYPPGIPLLVPGERFTEKQCSAIEAFISQGLNVQGVFHAEARDALWNEQDIQRNRGCRRPGELLVKTLAEKNMYD
ncbi:MAG: aminotransferase class I/II-fold pyridoxal phosphate-dependent enzyme [Lachnospiraceae bacterium]|nr:aminotransferase class I/II-fold pyridoxal phosphate-dependent enzyme [Lachnospiraceae bacterium]